MGLIKFYEDVLASVGLTVDKDGFILVPGEGDSTDKTILVGEKVLVLPTKDRLENLTSTIDGKVVVNNTIFNPLKEDPVKGESESLKKLKNIIDIRLSYSLATVIEHLLKLGADLELQKKASLNLTSFIGSLNSVRTGNMKNVIDDGTLTRWGNVYSAAINSTSTKALLHMFLKKGGMLAGVKYNRLAVMTAPMYKELGKIDKNIPLYGVKLRPKDIEVFKLLYEYIFINIDNPEKYMVGSQDGTSPGFISLFELYIHVATRLNGLLKELMFIDKENVESGLLNIKVTVDDLKNLDRFSNELAIIPSDLDVNRPARSLVAEVPQQVPMTNAPQTTGKVTARSILEEQRKNALGQIQQANVMQNTMLPIQQNVPMEQPMNMNPVKKILYGNIAIPNGSNTGQARPIGINNIQAMQQAQVMQQQPMMQPNMMQPNNMGMPNQYGMPQQRPMGVNIMGNNGFY